MKTSIYSRIIFLVLLHFFTVSLNGQNIDPVGDQIDPYFSPQFLTSDIIHGCEDTYNVCVVYPSNNPPVGLRYGKFVGGFSRWNLEEYDIDVLECSNADGTIDNYEFAKRCCLTFPNDFIDEVHKNRVFFFKKPYFKIVIEFANGEELSGSYLIYDFDSEGDNFYIDYANSSIIEPGIFKEGVLKGLVEDGCYSACGKPDNCPGREVTASQIIGTSIGGSLTLPYIDFEFSVQRTWENGTEITYIIDPITITSGSSEICFPLFKLKVDKLAVDVFVLSDGCNSPKRLVGRQVIYRPVGGVAGLSYQNQNYCIPIDNCAKFFEKYLNGESPVGIPYFEDLPNHVKFKIEFKLPPDTRGAIDIEWENLDPPNPFLIEDVAPGTYCYTISTSCCTETIQDCIEICPGMGLGEWQIDMENNQACREVSCEGDSFANGTSGKKADPVLVYEECKEISFGPYTFDLATESCQRAIYIAETNEEIGMDSKPATIVNRFDDLTNQCIKEYYCGDEDEWPVQTETGFPFYHAPWQFDFTLNKCYREVTCFGEVLSDEENRDTKLPEMEWEYNSLTGFCEGTILCEGSPVFGVPPVNQFPGSLGFWQYDWVSGQCKRTIQCDPADINSTIEQVEDPEIDWDYNQLTNQCEGQVICDGTPVFGAVINQFTNYETPWTVDFFTNNGIQCTKKVYCGSENAEVDVFIDPQYQNSGIEGDGTNGCPPGFDIHYIICDGYNTNEIVCDVGGGNRKPGKESPDPRFSSSIKVTPNPFTSEVKVNVTVLEDGNYHIKVNNINGALLFTQDFNAYKGLNTLAFDKLNTLAEGVYFLTVVSGNGAIIGKEKIVKM